MPDGAVGLSDHAAAEESKHPKEDGPGLPKRGSVPSSYLLIPASPRTRIPLLYRHAPGNVLVKQIFPLGDESHLFFGFNY